jgi:murein DD-endopeptidase MepM/ murein hydrolase activator NlpD
MKQLRDYKRLFRLFIFFVILALPIFFSSAQTAEEVRQKIEDKNAEIEKIESEIRSYQKQLGDLSNQKVTLASSLKQLDLTRKKLNADISLTQKKIDKTNLKIENLSTDIAKKEGNIDQNHKALAIDIRNMEELEQVGLTEMMLSDSDFTSFWNNIDNMAQMRKSLLERIDSLRIVKGELEGTRDETIEAKNELVSLRQELADQKKIVDQNTAEKNKLLKQTQNSEANFQKLVKDQSAKKLALEQEIRNYESQLKFILDPSKLPGAGVLSWPLDDIFVTQQFGVKTGPHRIYANGHSGTDFRARTPLKTYAMADGTVLGTGNTDISCPGASFGQWVFIQYDNGLSSTHAHLSLIKVSKGQRVGRGEVIGYTGGTGRVTAPHLHISLYAPKSAKVETIPSKSCPGQTLTQPIAATNGYLDPMFYLPAYTAQ